MALAYLGLGGNVGDTRAYFEAAKEKLKGLGTIRAVSSLYRTEPVGLAGQPWFLNCALILETDMSPHDLLSSLKVIEKELGRIPTVTNGPREIDIDILLYDDMIIETENLTIPHPRMHERKFVLLPLFEIASKATHPILKKTIAELIVHVADTHICEPVP